MKTSVIFAISALMLSAPAMSIQCGIIDSISANEENIVLVSIDNSPWYALLSQNEVLIAEKAYMSKLPVCYNTTGKDEEIIGISDITIGKKAAPKQ